MPTRYPPLTRVPHMLHGGDYNPDQWLHDPQVLQDDLRLMREAGVNAVSLGVFAWAALEPEEGHYTFGWLDRVMDDLAENGVHVALATPSGAKPAWMSDKYPEIRRVSADGVREPHRGRHNHCRTSPIYRAKCAEMNSRLAERYGAHPALILWHVSNEYNGGECHCELCYAAFRRWLQERYGTLDALNLAWWTAFWSHTYTSWEQIRPVDPSIHGLMLDWQRFTTWQTTDFFKAECVPLRQYAPQIPVTTNFMGVSQTLDYRVLAREVDVISWDSYPHWHGPVDDATLGAQVGFVHDLNRSFKGGRPFLLLESTPSSQHNMPAMRLKRPGMHRLASLQAIAHGSDSVMYFQWRAGRGGAEKLHGAVVTHDGTSNTRVFRDVADVGDVLARLDDVVGTTVPSQVAIIYDWQNSWAVENARGPLQQGKAYTDTCIAHYAAFWKQGIPVDVIGPEDDLCRYRLVVAPMLYMVRGDLGERLESYVRSGGTFVNTYWSGIVDENDLCFPLGRPGPLRALLGIWCEETDALYPGQTNTLEPVRNNALGLRGSFVCRDLCDLLHLEGAEMLASYGGDFYSGLPALTEHRVGDGRAYYMATRTAGDFLYAFYEGLTADLGIPRALDAVLPEGVSVQVRTDGVRQFLFVMNFSSEWQMVDLGEERYTDVLTGQEVTGRLPLDEYGARVLASAAPEVARPAGHQQPTEEQP